MSASSGRPVKLFDRMPEPDEMHDDPPGIKAAALMLREHGINPWNVPNQIDALTVDGWLRPTGRIVGNEIETERVPWGIPADAVTAILEAFGRIDWDAARRERERERVELTVRPPYQPGEPPTIRQGDYQAAIRYWRLRVSTWRWLTVSAAFGGFAIAWTLRGILGT